MQQLNLLNLDHKPKEYSKLFFGDYGQLGRLDKLNFEVFKNLAEASESNTWFMNEISYAKDKIGWETLPANAQRMFKLNILYQSAMDALVPDVFGYLSNMVTDTWLTYAYSRINTEEQIHNLSYSSGLTQVFGAEATNMIDAIYEDELLKRRTAKEIESAEQFVTYVHNEGHSDDKAKKLILELLVRTYMLEGLKFPFSFFVTWTINKGFKNAIQGFSQALKLIAWDELTYHVPVGRNVMMILKNDTTQEFSHLFNSGWFAEMLTEVVKETVALEIEWADYLLQDGEIPEFNREIAVHFIKYWAGERMKELKVSPIYSEKESDIITWYNRYRDLNNTHTALMEAETTNYQKGKLKKDFDSYDWDTLSKL